MAKAEDRKCTLCSKKPKDGCSHVDCPERKAVLWAPPTPGRILPKGHPGKE